MMVYGMAKELYCPECETEYWGSIQNAKCGECEHTFTPHEIHQALGYRSVSNDNEEV